jgi:hypothetical protein
VAAANRDFGPFKLPRDRSKWIDAAVTQKVILSVQALGRMKSEAVGCDPASQALVKSGELLIVGARYKLATGASIKAVYKAAFWKAGDAAITFVGRN